MTIFTIELDTNKGTTKIESIPNKYAKRERILAMMLLRQLITNLELIDDKKTLDALEKGEIKDE